MSSEAADFTNSAHSAQTAPQLLSCPRSECGHSFAHSFDYGSQPTVAAHESHGVADGPQTGDRNPTSNPRQKLGSRYAFFSRTSVLMPKAKLASKGRIMLFSLQLLGGRSPRLFR